MECPNNEKFVLLSNSIETFLTPSHFNCVCDWLSSVPLVMSSILMFMQLFLKRLSKKVHTIILKGIEVGFEFIVLQFERIALEAIDVCLQVLKESNKSIGSAAVVSGNVY